MRPIQNRLTDAEPGCAPPYGPGLGARARSADPLRVAVPSPRLPRALTAVLLVIVVGACDRAPGQTASYGAKVRYVRGQPLHFPDVTVEFVGERESPASSYYPRGMTFYDFKVYQGSWAQLVSWSAGTGDIGPALFERAGYRYALELAMSDELGSLEEDELVLWRDVLPATEVPAATPTPTPAGPPLEAQDHFHRGLALFAAGLPEEAVPSFTQAIALYPEYVEAYRYRGDAYRELGRTDLARADYRQVLALNPQPDLRATVTAALDDMPEATAVAPTPTPQVSTPAPLRPVPIAPGQPFALALGQYGRLEPPGLSVEFYEVVEDTRCPRQVDCEIAGWARIAVLVWIPNVEPVEFVLSTDLAGGEDRVPYDEYEIRLLSLEPYPETPEKDITPEEYRATFVVTE